MMSFRGPLVPYLLVFSCVVGCGESSRATPPGDGGTRPGPDPEGQLDGGESEDKPDASGQLPTDHDGGGQLDAGDAEGDAGDRGPDAGSQEDAGEQEPPRWYEAKTAMELSISGPLGDAFRAAYAGLPDGIHPPERRKDPIDGGASYVDRAGVTQTPEVVLAVRGNSSLQECAFPKLKLSFDQRVAAPNDPFYATKKFKIGTHCGEEEGTGGTIGRLRHEKSTWREEVAYQLARALGITIMQTRPAIITYTDTSEEPAFEGPLTRKAFLLEHIDELARRLGATALEDPVDCGEDPGKLPDESDVIRVKIFHAMIGNWDWTLGPPETHGCGPIMNTEVLVFPDQEILLVPADFDLAAIVVGTVRNPDTNQEEAIEVANSAAAARASLETSLAGESKAAVASVKAEYLSKQQELAAIIDASLMDAEGKADAKQLLEGFFSAL